jgi:hypothetical protein
VPAPNPTVASEVTPAADPPAPTPPPQPAAVVQVGAHTVTTQPAPAEIVVQYAPHDGGTATASLQETGDTQSLASGSALFAGLADGTYTVQIDVVYPTESSGNSGIGAETVFRTHGVAVHAGDHVVISCDDNACTGIS